MPLYVCCAAAAAAWIDVFPPYLHVIVQSRYQASLSLVTDTTRALLGARSACGRPASAAPNQLWSVMRCCDRQVGKEIANVWKGLAEGEKEGYKQRASEAKAEFDQLYPKQPKQARSNKCHACRRSLHARPVIMKPCFSGLRTVDVCKTRCHVRPITWDVRQPCACEPRARHCEDHLH